MSLRKANSGKVVMIGTALSAPGGMTSVVRQYQRAGFFEVQAVRYISSYERAGLLTQVPVMLRALAVLTGLLLSGQVRLVHVHSASRGSFWRKSLFCALARFFDVPYVFHLHSGEFGVFVQEECSPWARRWVAHTLAGAARVVVLTAMWERELGRLFPGLRVSVLGNPVQVPDSGCPARGASKTVLFLGRLREKKGIVDLLNAVPAVLRRVPETHFVLAGDGDQADMSALAEQLGVSASVSFPGWIDGPEKDALLASASVLVLPSYFEGLPVCILEAMAAGVPVVASRVGGIPDVLEDGACGLLITPGDREALSDALVGVLTDPVLGERLRQRAFVQARQTFSVEAVLAALGGVYRDCRGVRAK